MPVSVKLCKICQTIRLFKSAQNPGEITTNLQFNFASVSGTSSIPHIIFISKSPIEIQVFLSKNFYQFFYPSRYNDHFA